MGSEMCIRDRLTTVRQHVEEIGAAAVNRLTQLMTEDHPAPSPALSQTFETSLQVRESA